MAPSSKPVREGVEGELVLPDGAGTIWYESEFLTHEEASQLYSDCLHAKSWARTPIMFFGKAVVQPRDTAFFGTKLYSYSGERRAPTGWRDDAPASVAIGELGRKIERHLNLPRHWFNVVLANKYLHGRDSMGYHSDNEKSLGAEPIIASISVGACRKFVVRPKPSFAAAHPSTTIEYKLGHGSLLVMRGRMQECYDHALPKVALSKCDKTRINLTYRRVVD